MLGSVSKLQEFYFDNIDRLKYLSEKERETIKKAKIVKDLIILIVFALILLAIEVAGITDGNTILCCLTIPCFLGFICEFVLTYGATDQENDIDSCIEDAVLENKRKHRIELGFAERYMVAPKVAVICPYFEADEEIEIPDGEVLYARTRDLIVQYMSEDDNRISKYQYLNCGPEFRNAKNWHRSFCVIVIKPES